MLHIGPHAIENPVFLAPMAGITDLPFRELCTRFGAGLATAEMLTSQASLWHTKKSQQRMKQSEHAGLKSVQIAGSEPEVMANAARLAEGFGAQIIDINMGCPAKKVCKKLAGSALLQDEKKVNEILNAVVSAVSIPVTLKTRTGWSHDVKNGLNIAKIAEQAGIAAIAVHGRTRACRFNGHAEYDTIAKIVEHVSIPVIANGDITSAEKAADVKNYTGAKAVMVGRAAFGNPWIIQEIIDALTNPTTANNNNQNIIKNRPKLKNFQQVMRRHLESIHDFYGAVQGVRIARKHVNWYAQTLATLGADAFNTRQFNAIEQPNLQLDALESYFKGSTKNEEHAA